MYRHSLIIGGTGMLEKATRTLMDQSEHTTLVARHASGFSQHVDAIDADYTNAGHFIETLSAHFFHTPPVDLAVIWMHRTGNEALQKLLPLLNAGPVSVIHLLGSAQGDPRQDNPLTPVLSDLPHITYISVALGRMGSRWLTHEEISDGTLEAIAHKRATVIGSI